MTRTIAALLLCGIAAALAVLLRRYEPFPAIDINEPDEEGLYVPMAAWTDANVAPMNTYTIHHHYGG